MYKLFDLTQDSLQVEWGRLCYHKILPHNKMVEIFFNCLLQPDAEHKTNNASRE